MNVGYKKFYERLRQEREENKWSQENISQLLCVTQGHYCKIESGYCRLTYKEIVDLNKNGINMYYVFTGEKVYDLGYKELLKGYTLNKQVWIYEIVATIVYNNLPSTALKKRITNTGNILEKIERNNIWNVLQEHNALTQVKMSEVLKIDVKKYRRLIRREILADSDVILHAYEYFRVSPMFFIEAKDALAHEICALMNMIDENKQKEIFEYAVLGCSKFIK